MNYNFLKFLQIVKESILILNGLSLILIFNVSFLKPTLFEVFRNIAISYYSEFFCYQESSLSILTNLSIWNLSSKKPCAKNADSIFSHRLLEDKTICLSISLFSNSLRYSCCKVIEDIKRSMWWHFSNKTTKRHWHEFQISTINLPHIL